ncbi:hypothetical protein E4U55_005524 [Claviceps digitariae]|nr:hypothetical protein E4U55_005524 [Claviceps digitariae]
MADFSEERTGCGEFSVEYGSPLSIYADFPIKDELAGRMDGHITCGVAKDDAWQTINDAGIARVHAARQSVEQAGFSVFCKECLPSQRYYLRSSGLCLSFYPRLASSPQGYGVVLKRASQAKGGSERMRLSIISFQTLPLHHQTGFLASMPEMIMVEYQYGDLNSYTTGDDGRRALFIFPEPLSPCLIDLGEARNVSKSLVSG